MKLTRKAIAIIALTTVCVANAHADNERNTSTLREQARAMQVEQALQRREQARVAEERRAMRIEQHEVVADNRGMQREEPRRAARMSPEERRALRRQIDEASHEIYSPSH